MDSDKKKVARILKGIRKQLTAPLYAAKKIKYIEGKAKKMSKKMTWPEREFKKMMNELGVDIVCQKIVGGKIYDFYEEKTNTLFEVDGNYFHGDKELYGELNAMQKRNIKNDEYKNIIALGYGYKIERIWESDLKNDYNGIKKRMRKLL